MKYGQTLLLVMKCIRLNSRREYIRTTTSLMSVSYPCESQYSNDEIHIPYIRKSIKTIIMKSDVLEEK
jgi:hypothetical protein